MKKTWTPQYRGKILYNPIFWVILLLVTFTVNLILYALIKDASVFIIFIIVAYYVYLFYLDLKRWNVGGYRSITVDSQLKMITFDNKINIPCQFIEKVELHLEEPPEKAWFTGRKLTDYVNEFNGSLKFTLKKNEELSIAVQFRGDAKEIIEALRDCGIAINMSESDKYDLTGMYQIAWYLMIIVPMVIWYLFKFYCNR